MDLDELRITVLVENTAPMSDRLRALHGLSMFVESRHEDHKTNVLFDVGADPGVLLNNLEALGFPPSIIDCIVLSHNHWDDAKGKLLYQLPFGAFVYSINNMSVVLDDNCMGKEESISLKFVILRENGKLYSQWDDEGSLIF